MIESTVKQMFGRRIFTQEERESMRELYSLTEIVAQRILRTVPHSFETDLAILRLKEALALCETAVAMHPRLSHQVEMGLDKRRHHTDQCDGVAEKPSPTRPS